MSIIEEERLLRKKHAIGTFPSMAVRRILESTNLALSDINHLTIPFEPHRWFFMQDVDPDNAMAMAEETIREELLNIFPDQSMPEITFHNHHASHAASAFYPSGFKEALVITADGTGEREATAVWQANDNGLVQIESHEWPHSLGEVYSSVTGYLGFLPASAEGKTMGLAAYGQFDPSLDTAFRDGVANRNGHHYSVNQAVAASTWEERYAHLEKVFGTPRLELDKREIIPDFFKNLAWQVQQFIEEVILDLVEKHKPDQLCLAGGLAMNVSMNGKILDSGFCKDLFVQPLAGDNGTVIGSALLKSIEITGSHNTPRQEHLYYGPDYANEEIEALLRDRKYLFQKMGDIEMTAAELLAEGKIIGWYQGRMEAGARALGNRSILSNPGSPGMCDRVNEVKHREKWRPLALSVLAEHADDVLEGPIPHCADFMIVTRRIRQAWHNRIPSALHVDGTTRPQVVREAVNPRYHQLISNFYKLTGIPLVLNSSMNDRGEPIVEHPDQALNFFNNIAVDALIINDFLIERAPVE